MAMDATNDLTAIQANAKRPTRTPMVSPHKLFSITACIIGVIMPCVVRAEATETAYARVLRTHTLRCGYNYYAPVLMQNEKLGKLEGIYID
jgi:acyl-CoA synthetase (AMP-forming)/AMP-acid ligase II